METSQAEEDRRRQSRPLALLADIARLKFAGLKKEAVAEASATMASVGSVKKNVQVAAAAKARAAKRAQKQKRPEDPNWNVIRAKASNELLHDELTKLMKDINVLLRKERKNVPAWIRKYKDDDPRCVFYHSMLRRVGLPERHARFAPWFLKSEKLQLNKYGQRLFEQFEAAYLTRETALSETEAAVRKHLEFLGRMMALKAPPRDKNQALVQRAFRDCSFPAPRTALLTSSHEPESAALHPLEASSPGTAEDDPEAVAHPDRLDSEDPRVVQLQIAPVPKAPAPPGLAPQVPGKLESHGKHTYYHYNGRWKDGHMRGAVGVYTFADGGKYVGAWKDSRPCGPGTAEYPNGCKYQGTWRDGKYHGLGTWEASDGTKYEGSWKDGLRDGKGKLTLPSGAVYDGHFFQNFRHGAGVEVSPLGHKYKGNFRRNRIYGEGRIEIDLGNGQVHVYAKDNWAPCVLGEAAAEARLHWSGVDMDTEMSMRSLLRVRDDLRALDLQLEYREKEAARIIAEKKAAKEARRDINRARREAEKLAKEALVNELIKEMSDDDEDDGYGYKKIKPKAAADGDEANGESDESDEDKEDDNEGGDNDASNETNQNDDADADKAPSPA
ncbi:hypothetical protein SPRG_00335 [Saprolegnia parasitica CBS 223.65]|uniref:Uncharacterized protein n=1 Tax=Saprolegnia parasitica (strain CBS 223.65) TaxID=695850 RepID=A0A067CY96_SAPPC|nr:hypothetical protein SPRG_00335 [Saprolegnia parasitica CBS 223.65]KDO35488.1 hypothetical protein SPRG_00335 [Saprolegnia parasitica CBS 223.65]|eukprot:XP_012193825.1 hypothetical protein SPRG_00335 [Saprolegnia parasitica CBS 223.65]